jgi:hypothetical protein
MTRTALGALLATLALTACDPAGPPVASRPSATGTIPAPTGSPGCPAPPALPAGATLVTATVTGNKVTTDHATWSVKTGSAVRIAVTADRADEVHVHGYDKKQDTVPGCPTAIDLTANIPGSVEVELESAGLHLFDLKAS